MKSKVKVFAEADHIELENKINSFIQSEECVQVLNIKIASAAEKVVALIAYRDYTRPLADKPFRRNNDYRSKYALTPAQYRY